MNNTLEIVIQKKPQKWRHIFEQFSNFSSERENQTTKRLPQTFLHLFENSKEMKNSTFFIEDVSVLKLHFSFEKKLKQRSFFFSLAVAYDTRNVRNWPSLEVEEVFLFDGYDPLALLYVSMHFFPACFQAWNVA